MLKEGCPMTGRFLAFSTFLMALLISPAIATATDYHHIHLVAQSRAEAKEWYMTHMGCTDYGRPDACQIGSTYIIFFEREPTGPSVGSGVDHIGFSFEDLEAKMTSFEMAGITVIEPVRENDLYKIAYIEDPWGTKIAVVEDPETLGFHHIHLRSPDPAVALSWYWDMFGGERDRLKGRIGGLRYGTVWLLIAQHEGELAPTEGRAFDHLGWQFPDLRSEAENIKRKGVEFDIEPRLFTNPLGEDMLISFITSPDGIRIEIVQPRA